MKSKKIKIFKPRYIRKYDFLRSLNRPKSLWFVPDDQIVNFFVNQNDKSFSDDFEEETNDVEEFDSIEFFREKKTRLSNSNMASETSAKIIEGQILDRKAKDFIIKWYTSVANSRQKISIYDFDEIFQDNLDLEKQFIHFQELIKNNQNAIFFQPTIISKKIKAVTKPDALVRIDGIWELIEVKGTTTSKKKHLLDMLFQKKIIYQSGLELNIVNYYLCVVAYEKVRKNHVSFILTQNFLPKKNYADTALIKTYITEYGKDDLKVLKEKQKEKIGNTLFPMKFKALLDWQLDQIPTKEINVTEWSVFYYDNIYLRFDQIVAELHEYLNSIQNDEVEITVGPSWVFHNFFSDFDYMNQLKFFLSSCGYCQFKFSGNVLCWNYAMLIYQYQMDTEATIICLGKDKHYLKEFLLKTRSENPNIFLSKASFSKLGSFYAKCLESKKDIYLEKNKVNQLLKKLKTKKVYFDFETISLAIRPIDNILPFTQIITQCSILKDFNGRMDQKCQNLIADPQKITSTFFKEVIDALYEGDDCSYIVYNKSFEKTRLQELITYLNDDDYADKIVTIVNNIFDLADFFYLGKQTICLKNLYGSHSIKKILPLILNNQKIVQKTKVVDYRKLDVKRGDQCQDITTQRFYKMLSDNEWKKVQVQLQTYCENDVRVMVAIYEYIKEIIKIFD